MFASKTPRDLNRDPLPFVTRDELRYRNSCTCGCNISRHDPRPEYDRPQHNEPNPILLAFRDHVAWNWVYLPHDTTYAEDVETFDGLRDGAFLNTTPAQVDHARKVLQRLAALS